MNLSGIFVLAFTFACVGASKCPEPKKPHPTSCSIFYNCVNLPGGGYVWIPAKCSKGLMFQPYLRTCVLPGDSWTCDILATESPQTTKTQTPDFTKPGDTIHTSYSSDSTNEFSEPIASSYIVDEYSEITEHEATVTPYPLIEVTETTTRSSDIDDAIKNIGLPIAIKHSEDNYLYHFVHGDEVLSTPVNANNQQLQEHLERLTQLVDKLIGYQSLGIPLDRQVPSTTTASTTTSTTTERPPMKDSLIENNHVLDNQEVAILNLLVKSYLQQTKLDAATTTTPTTAMPTTTEPTTERATIMDDIPDNKARQSDEETTDSNDFDTVINGAEASNNIIVVTDSLDNKQYFTMNKYKSIAGRLQSETVNLLPCTKGVRLPNSTDCTKYYYCDPQSAALMELSCPPNTAFNGFTRICDTKAYADCTSESTKIPLRISVTTSKPTQTRTALQEGIPKENPCQTIGKYGDSVSETHYYLCYSVGKSEDIQYQRMRCPNGLKFCQLKNVCTTKKRCKD